MKPHYRNTFANALIVAIIAAGIVCAVSTVLRWSDGWEIQEEAE